MASQVGASRTDRFGFYLDDTPNEMKSDTLTPANPAHVWLENRRTQKWVAMLGSQFEQWQTCQQAKPKLLQKRMRKGIPEAMRGSVWCRLTNALQIQQDNPKVYSDLVQRQSGAACLDAINRDIGRTFPHHALFNSPLSPGQTALRNVLTAYSLYDPEVGYCQGMGFLTALFLSYMPESQAFWTLVACLTHRRYDLSGLYRPRMPKVAQVLHVYERLLHRMVPAVAKHLDLMGVHPTMYSSQWFITIFTYNFPFAFVTRVWDVFLLEGWKVVFRIALALMKLSQKALLTMEFDAIMGYLKELPHKVDPDLVFATAFKLPLKRTQIAQLEEEFTRRNAAN